MRHSELTVSLFVFHMDAIKATGNELELEVLGAPYGVDKQGQEFHAGTDFGDLPMVPVIYWHGWGADDGERIGWAYKAKRDEAGQWYRVVLDRTKQVAGKIYSDAVKGLVRASSDALSHLVRPHGVLNKPGRIDRWVIGALSLMDSYTSDTAVNPRAIAIASVKAYYEELLKQTEDEVAEAVKAGAKYSRETRERMREARTTLSAAVTALDGMIQEFPDEQKPTEGDEDINEVEDMEGTETKTPVVPVVDQEAVKAAVAEAVKAQLAEIEAGEKAAAAAKAQADADAKAKAEADEAAVKASREATEAAVKAAVAEALKGYNRVPFAAPAVIKSEEDYADPMPLQWAIKAAKLTGGEIEFSAEGKKLRYGGSADAVKAFKAMATTSGSAIGEHFVPRVQSNLVTAALYQQVISRSLPGVRVYPMSGLVVDAPTIGAFSAGWSAENAAATNAGDAATNRKTLTAKNLTALATISNQLLEDSDPAVESWIRDGMAEAMGEAHDTGAFFGTGLSNQPTGITGTAGVTSTAIGSDDIITAIIKAIGRMKTNKLKISPSNTAIIMHPAVVTKALTTRVGASGDFVVSGSAVDPQLGTFFSGASFEGQLSRRIGYPVVTSTVIPVATGTAASTVMVLYCPDFVIGDRQEMNIAASNVAGSAFANNQTLVRAIMRVDFLLLRAASLELITGVTH